MNPYSLLAAAHDLIEAGQGRPRQANLCRATSTAYYAMFHCLAACCADTIVGGSGSDRSEPAWRQTYRAPEHGTVRQRCGRSSIVSRFPNEIQDFAEKFVEMQEKRHRADYDPEANFSKLIVKRDIEVVTRRIEMFNQAPLKDRRAFAVYVLLNVRGQ